MDHAHEDAQMSMNWREHMEQAGLLLKEAEEDLATVHAPEQLEIIKLHIEMAHVHAVLAEVKRVRS